MWSCQALIYGEITAVHFAFTAFQAIIELTMTKRLLLLCTLSGGLGLFAQHDHAAPQSPAILLPGLGNGHHAIATSSAEAQKFFDQGLTLVYAFNHEEAIRSFQRAAELDQHEVMPLWGIALALGPNINQDVDADGEKAAYSAIEAALAKIAGAPPKERAYVEALAKRYSADPAADRAKLGAAHRDAMRELMTRYPDDMDAATLYAESIMDLRPWRLWQLDGSPAEDTEELVNVLEGILRRDPSHIGANHYYIHTMEASRHPERALPSADRLGALCPAAGHLVHMPGHIYINVGDYAAAARVNEEAIRADQSYMQLTGAQTMYTAMYYHHNIHFLSVARAEQGRVEETRDASRKLSAGLAPIIARMPMAEGFMTAPISVLLRVQLWDDVLAFPQPTSNMLVTTAFWRFARATSYVHKGDRKSAEQERSLFLTAAKAVPPEMSFGFINPAKDVFALAAEILAAALDTEPNRAIVHWRRAVSMQDQLAYDEPEAWYYPVRESLGAALLMDRQAGQAEEAFRGCLLRKPRDGRALFGLMQSLKAQNKTDDLEQVARAYKAAWDGATLKLKIEDF